jgi:hypothetical protein
MMEHVAFRARENYIADSILVSKSQEKRSAGRPRRRRAKVKVKLSL